MRSVALGSFLLVVIGCSSPVDGQDGAQDGGASDLDADATRSDSDDADRDADQDGERDAPVDGEPRDADVTDADVTDADHDAELGDDAETGSPSPVPFLIEGFGAHAVGGWQLDHGEVRVTSLADGGEGSLRAALETGDAPTVVRFDVEGTIDLEAPLVVPSNVTIDGRGADVTLRGKGLVIAGRDQVIVTGLTIEDVGPISEDGIQISADGGAPSTNVVVDHVHFRATGDLGSAESMDEALSVVWGSREVTVQWCRFENIEKVMLLGNGDADESVDGAISVTVCHNWFQQTGRRHPRARFGRFDVYNNFFDRWHRFSSAAIETEGRRTFGAWCHDGCRMIMEANVFSRQPHPNDYAIGVQWPNQASRCAPDPLNAVTGGEFAGTIEDRGGYTTLDTTSSLLFDVGCEAGATVFERPYRAYVERADEDLRAFLESAAGDL